MQPYDSTNTTASDPRPRRPSDVPLAADSPPPRAEDQQRVEQQIQLGIDSLRAGRLHDAYEYLRAALRIQPDHPLANNCLGIVHRNRGEAADAVACYERAIRVKPEYAEAHNNLGIALEACGETVRAMECYQAALRSSPRFAAAHNNLGNVLTKQGSHAEAVACFDAALAACPESPEALNNKGLALRELGQQYEAESSFRKALQQRPQFAEAYLNLGNILHDQGSLNAAHECFLESVKANPNFLTGVVRLGNSHYELGNPAEAAELFLAVLQVAPQHPQAWLGLGSVRQQNNELDEAVECFHHALETQPDLVDAMSHLGNALARQGKIDEAVRVLSEAATLAPDQVTLHNNLGNLYRLQDRVEEAAASYSEVLRRRPQGKVDALRFSSLCPTVFETLDQMDEYLANSLQEWTSLRGEAEYGDLGDLLAIANEPPYNLQFSSGNIRQMKEAYANVFRYRGPEYRGQPNNGPIQVGLVVTSHHEIAFLRLIWDALRQMNRDEFQLSILCMSPAAAKFRATISDPNVTIRPLPDRPDQTTAAIRHANLDILYYFEIGTDCLNYFLPFFRLAPVQCTSWGIQVTSGVSNLDYYLSSQLFEPEDAAGHYSEQLVCAPSLLAYQTPIQLPQNPKSREAFGFDASQTIYLCPQHLGKFHPDFDTMLGEILRGDERGLVVITADRYGYGASRLTARLLQRIGDVADRVVFVSKQSLPDYVSLVAAADVLLDAPHFSGVNTTYDALALDQPVVSMPSRFHRGRYTFGCYQKMDLFDCVADGAADYVQIALSLGRDSEYRHSIRQKISERKHLLFRDDGAIRDHEQIFRTLAAEARDR